MPDIKAVAGSGSSGAGIALMIGAMLLIPVVNGIARFLSSDYSPTVYCCRGDGVV